MATSSKGRSWVPTSDTKTTNFITIQPFSYPDSTWRGSSFVMGEFQFTANIEFVLPMDIVPPPNSYYLLAIRFYDPFTDELVRYKLYSHPDVDMHYPPYKGQVIDVDFVIEIWCTKDHAAVNLESWNINTGILNLQVECCGCTIDGTTLPATLDNNLFAELLPYGQSGSPTTPTPSVLLTFDQEFTNE